MEELQCVVIIIICGRDGVGRLPVGRGATHDRRKTFPQAVHNGADGGECDTHQCSAVHELDIHHRLGDVQATNTLQISVKGYILEVW
jgi:hypothetical protein